MKKRGIIVVLFVAILSFAIGCSSSSAPKVELPSFEDGTVEATFGSQFNLLTSVSDTAGNEHRLSAVVTNAVTGAGVTVLNDRFDVLSMDGYKIVYTAEISDSNRPSITVTVNVVYNGTPTISFGSVVPAGEIGREFVLPSYGVYDPTGGATTSSATLYRVPTSGNAVAVSVANGRFTPTEGGNYQYRVTAKDAFNNEDNAVFSFYIRELPQYNEVESFDHQTSVYNVVGNTFSGEYCTDDIDGVVKSYKMTGATEYPAFRIKPRLDASAYESFNYITFKIYLDPNSVATERQNKTININGGVEMLLPVGRWTEIFVSRQDFLTEYNTDGTFRLFTVFNDGADSSDERAIDNTFVVYIADIKMDANTAIGEEVYTTNTIRVSNQTIDGVNGATKFVAGTKWPAVFARTNELQEAYSSATHLEVKIYIDQSTVAQERTHKFIASGASSLVRDSVLVPVGEWYSLYVPVESLQNGFYANSNNSFAPLFTFFNDGEEEHPARKIDKPFEFYIKLGKATNPNATTSTASTAVDFGSASALSAVALNKTGVAVVKTDTLAGVQGYLEVTASPINYPEFTITTQRNKTDFAMSYFKIYIYINENSVAQGREYKYLQTPTDPMADVLVPVGEWFEMYLPISAMYSGNNAVGLKFVFLNDNNGEPSRAKDNGFTYYLGGFEMVGGSSSLSATSKLLDFTSDTVLNYVNIGARLSYTAQTITDSNNVSVSGAVEVDVNGSKAVYPYVGLTTVREQADLAGYNFMAIKLYINGTFEAYSSEEGRFVASHKNTYTLSYNPRIANIFNSADSTSIPTDTWVTFFIPINSIVDTAQNADLTNLFNSYLNIILLNNSANEWFTYYLGGFDLVANNYATTGGQILDVSDINVLSSVTAYNVSTLTYQFASVGGVSGAIKATATTSITYPEIRYTTANSREYYTNLGYTYLAIKVYIEADVVEKYIELFTRDISGMFILLADGTRTISGNVPTNEWLTIYMPISGMTNVGDLFGGKVAKMFHIDNTSSASVNNLAFYIGGFDAIKNQPTGDQLIDLTSPTALSHVKINGIKTYTAQTITDVNNVSVAGAIKVTSNSANKYPYVGLTVLRDETEINASFFTIKMLVEASSFTTPPDYLTVRNNPRFGGMNNSVDTLNLPLDTWITFYVPVDSVKNSSNSADWINLFNGDCTNFILIDNEAGITFSYYLGGFDMVSSEYAPTGAQILNLNDVNVIKSITNHLISRTAYVTTPIDGVVGAIKAVSNGVNYPEIRYICPNPRQYYLEQGFTHLQIKVYIEAESATKNLELFTRDISGIYIKLADNTTMYSGNVPTNEWFNIYMPISGMTNVGDVFDGKTAKMFHINNVAPHTVDANFAFYIGGFDAVTL